MSASEMDPGLDDNARIKSSAASGDAQTTAQIGSDGQIGKTMDFGAEIDPHLLAMFDDEDDPMFLNEEDNEKRKSKGYFRPDSPPRTGWEMLMVFFTLYCAFAIPLYMAWGISASGFWQNFEFVMDGCFLADLFLCMRTGYYDEDLRASVYDQKKILIKYAQGWLLIDAFAAFPLSWFADAMAASAGPGSKENMQVMRVIRLSRTGSRLLRMVKVIKANKMIVAAQNNYELNPAYIKIVKFTIFIVMMTHMLSCLWFAAAKQTTTGPGLVDEDGNVLYEYDTWLLQYGMPEDAPLWEQYVAAYYWCVCTITTVGYGDISAHSVPERNVAIFSAALGATMFAFVCGNMTSIVVAMDKDAFLIQRKLDALNSFMQIREISKPLRVKARAFCRHVWANTVFSEAQVVRELSPGLRMQVSLEVFKDVVKSVPLFRPLRDSHVSLLCQKLRGISVAPTELVVAAGDDGQEMYIVKDGVLDVISADGSTKFATLRKTAYFGEISVILGQKRTANVRARVLCDLLVLRMRDFKAALGDYPEIMAMLRATALQTLDGNKTRQAEADVDRAQQVQVTLKEGKEKRKFENNAMRSTMKFENNVMRSTMKFENDGMRSTMKIANPLFLRCVACTPAFYIVCLCLRVAGAL